MTITKVIKALYVKLGGSLTDTYSEIADGAPVSSYSVISDCIKALYVLYGGDLTEVYPAISDVAVKDYTTSAKAIAALVKVISKGITPTGTISITENGENIDVAQYATADVNVPQGVMVDESYDISEGTLNSATVELEGGITANIPDGVVTLGGGAFSNNTVIDKVIMPNSVTVIEDGAPWTTNKGCFISCIRLKTIIFSNTLTKIGNFAFGSCTALTSIEIPNSVTSIGQQAFGSCTALTSIEIPKSVTSIGEGAFTTTALTDIYYTGTQAEWEAIDGIANAGFKGTETIHYEYIPET